MCATEFPHRFYRTDFETYLSKLLSGINNRSEMTGIFTVHSQKTEDQA